MLGSLAVLECRQHSQKITVQTSIIRFVCLPICPRTFSHYRPHQTKHNVSQFRVFFFKHNSVQQHTRQGQCSTCIKLHDYKLPQASFPHPNRPPRVIFFGVRIWLVKVLGRFSINYFRGLGLRIRVWVRV